MKKRVISLTMVLALCLMLLPVSAFAAEDSGAATETSGLCAHHTEHDDTCGYVEGIAGSPCTHEHSEECYTKVTSCIHEHTPDCYPAEDSSIPEDGTTSSEDTEAPEATPSEPAEPTACSHVCSVESGCIKLELDCQHEHNDECGYAPAVEGQPCTYVCTLCGMTEITAWSWVDTQDVLDPESGVLVLSASAESPVPYEDIVDLLPAEIEATTADGTETLSLDSWSCDDYPAEGAYTGSYAFHAVLPEGYGLAADAPALTVTVELDDEVMLMSKYFVSDDSAYKLETSGSTIIRTPAHTHDWQFKKEDGNDSKIFVICEGTVGTCDYQNNPAIVSISTTQKEYDYEKITEAPKAVLTYSDNWPDGLAQAQESAIEYYKRADDGNNYNLVYNKEDLKNPGYYLAQLDFVKGSKYLVTYFSVVDNRKTDPQYTAPTAITGLTYNGQEQDLITPGSATGGTMQYKLDTADAYSTFIPTATNAGTYTVYYKVVGDATHNDTAEQSITVTIGKASLTGAPTFTPVTEAGKTIGDVTPNVPAGWHGGVLYWYGEGEAELDSTTLIKQGASYEWFFKPADSNYQGIGGKLVLWADTSGDSSSNPGDGNSSNTSGGGSNTGGSSSDDGNTSDIGNSNNGSSNANIPPTPVTVPVSGDEKTIQVDAVVSGTTATIKNVDLSKLDTVIGDTVKNGVVTIDFSVLKKVDNVKLPSNVVKQIAEAVNEPDNDAKDLEIVLANGTSIKLDAKMLGEKNVKANGVDITISIKRITGSSLNIKQKQAVGSRPALDINVTIGGKPISDMNGKVTVSAAYELKPGEHASGIVVSYVDANGNRQLCETSYDPIRKQVSWKTGSLSPSSVYMIGYDESRVRTYVTYTVQKGSTLSMIAKKHGCTVADIMAANSGLIKNPNRIFEGWQLKIPQD